MTLQTTGAISLSDIQGEFGGSNPISISEYYGDAAGIPSSGTIDFSDFYGKTAPAPDITALYSGSTSDSFSSVGIAWLFRNRLSGSSSTPSTGGYVTITGSGTYPAVYAGSSSAADSYITLFGQRSYLGLAGLYADTNTTWTKLALTADSRPNEYMIYASDVPTSSSTPASNYVAGVNSPSTAARIDWYN